MNTADKTLLNWLDTQINTGRKNIVVPADLLEDTTSEGLAEAQRLAKLCGVELAVR